MKLIYVILILGFLLVDFFFFHDLFKAGETVTVAQYLTGFLSLLVFFTSGRALLKG